jgi:ATP-dependent Clp protease ATP-binding subunit ClpC
MFERYTDQARRVLVQAQDEARMRNHNYIGTEHLLLGLVNEGGGVAAEALESLGISLETVRQQVEAIIGMGQQAPRDGHLPFTARTEKVLELCSREAFVFGHHYIGTEHLLLALNRESDGVAGQVLAGLGADLGRVSRQVTELLRGDQGEDETWTARAAGRSGEAGHAESELSEILGRLDSIESRLWVIEQSHLPPQP